MDDMQAFERRVAKEAGWLLGPERQVDDAAILAAVTAAAQSPQRRLQSMFSAFKFAIAGIIVAVFGGFLLLGLPTTVTNDPAAPSSESSPSASPSAIVSGIVSPDVAVDAGTALTISLADVRPGREPIAEVVIEIAEAVDVGGEIPFSLEYRSDAIDPDRMYTVSARVGDGDAVTAQSLTGARVITGGKPSEGVTVDLIDPLTLTGLSRTVVLDASDEMPDAVDGARYVVRLEEDGVDGASATIAEVTLDGVSELRPSVEATVLYDGDRIDSEARYRLDVVLEDAVTGELLGVSQDGSQALVYPSELSEKGTWDPFHVVVVPPPGQPG